MRINELPRIITRPKKRVGRGIGSGKGGHTSSRGNKGQKAREDVPLLYEGTKTKKSLVKRIPLLRGKGKLKPNEKPVILHLGDLADLPAKSEVTLKSLGLTRVKILDGGEIKQALVIKVPISAGAAKKIVKAGGKIEGNE
ncbi:MAG: uL15m family ribosomal protein [Patescibacteria group bacterium]